MNSFEFYYYYCCCCLEKEYTVTHTINIKLLTPNH